MRIRSITLHLPWDDDYSIVAKFKQAAEELNPVTVRVSISPPPPRAAERAVAKLRDMGINYISALHLYYSVEEVYKYVAEYGVFASFTDVGEYLKFLRTIYDKGDVHLSRYVSLLAGGLVFNSPYFPASITTKRGISLSLLYPNDIKTLSDVEEALKKGEQLGNYISSALGLEFLGVDGSLSPWGEESVAKAVERLFGTKLGTPGSHYAIWQLNKAIKSAEVKKVGFNEVMLPLAEDEELKRLVRAGALTLRDFVSYTAVCVPGLDMAPIRVKDWNSLKRLLYDLVAIAEAKGRPIGVRIFPVDEEEYGVAGFGNTPALEI